MNVYLAMAEYSYEGASVVKAFATKPDADAFVTRCNEHNAKERPPAPPIEDTPENDAAHEAWWAKVQEWEKAHPAPDNTGADSFYVREIAVEDSPTKDTIRR